MFTFAAASICIAATTASAGQVCSADLDGDGQVSTSDLTTLLGNFGAQVPAGTGGDITGDGRITTSDLSILLGEFGTSCTPAPQVFEIDTDTIEVGSLVTLSGAGLDQDGDKDPDDYCVAFIDDSADGRRPAIATAAVIAVQGDRLVIQVDTLPVGFKRGRLVLREGDGGPMRIAPRPGIRPIRAWGWVPNPMIPEPVFPNGPIIVGGGGGGDEGECGGACSSSNTSIGSWFPLGVADPNAGLLSNVFNDSFDGECPVGTTVCVRFRAKIKPTDTTCWLDSYYSFSNTTASADIDACIAEICRWINEDVLFACDGGTSEEFTCQDLVVFDPVGGDFDMVGINILAADAGSSVDGTFALNLFDITVCRP